MFKSSSALEKNKTILISALIILAAFVITLFVPSSDIRILEIGPRPLRFWLPHGFWKEPCLWSEPYPGMEC